MAGGSSGHGGLGRSPVRRPAGEAQPQRTSPPTYAIFLCNRSSESFFLIYSCSSGKRVKRVGKTKQKKNEEEGEQKQTRKGEGKCLIYRDELRS